MSRFWSSNHWHYQALRITLISATAYFLMFHAVGFSDNAQYEWPKTDFSRSLVDLQEIISGGPPKDGIPAIDKPTFITANQAGKWLDDREPVIVVELAGKTRAYPLQILMYHEIVNDDLAGIPISVTFCPLCNASIVFERRVNGNTLDFGTTGRLRKSDMVMYDRQTESWWQQFTGTAIVGKYTGTELKQLPSSIVAFSDFRQNYPLGKILSRDTGYSRPYGNNPYRGYDDINDRPFLFSDKLDPRLPPMERVIGIMVGNKSKIYPYAIIESKSIINDHFQEIPLVIFSTPGMLSVLDDEIIKNSKTIPSAKAYRRELNGKILTFRITGNTKIIDNQTQSVWNIFGQAVAGKLKGERLTSIDSGVHFAFAWLAFRPNTEVYD
ncbi:MAG: DUF3179 domain-containing protein [Gammaproteobacteria bacterium]|nr:DUF3179 domain-containing protein [Gammaproteobacteria bacterium]